MVPCSWQTTNRNRLADQPLARLRRSAARRRAGRALPDGPGTRGTVNAGPPGFERLSDTNLATRNGRPKRGTRDRIAEGDSPVGSSFLSPGNDRRCTGRQLEGRNQERDVMASGTATEDDSPADRPATVPARSSPRSAPSCSAWRMAPSRSSAPSLASPPQHRTPMPCCWPGPRRVSFCWMEVPEIRGASPAPISGAG